MGSEHDDDAARACGSEETLELINSELAARLARQSESGAKTIFLVGFAATAAHDANP